MTPVPSGSRVWLATGHTDMRKGFDGLAALVQDHLARDPFSGQAFVFRGRQGHLITDALKVAETTRPGTRRQRAPFGYQWISTSSSSPGSASWCC